MSRTFQTRSQAAEAAQRELGEGKFFRTTRNAEGDWKWHYEPGDCPAAYMVGLEWVAWVEIYWDREIGPEPVKVGVVVITCPFNELADQERDATGPFKVEPITPELFEDPKAPAARKERVAATGERAKSDVANPTKLVWQIADDMPGASRADVIAACVAAGVNKSTASTQIYRWQKARAV